MKALPKTMRAAAIDRFGGLKVLTIHTWASDLPTVPLKRSCQSKPSGASVTRGAQAPHPKPLSPAGARGFEVARARARASVH